MLESVLSHKCRSYVVSTHIVLCLTCSRVRYRVLSCVRESTAAGPAGAGTAVIGNASVRQAESCVDVYIDHVGHAASCVRVCRVWRERSQLEVGRLAGATANAASAPPDTASAGLAVEMFEYESG